MAWVAAVIMVADRVDLAVIAKVAAEAAKAVATWAVWAMVAQAAECDFGTRLRPGFLLPCQQAVPRIGAWQSHLLKHPVKACQKQLQVKLRWYS